MGQRLKGKIAVITGAASGIGRATVERFVEEGAQVVASDINPQPLKSLAEEGAESPLETIAGDVSDRTQAQAVINRALERWGRLDILVNSAGITPRTVDPAADVAQRWDAVMQVNVKGTLLMCHAAVEAMRQSSGGAIVNMGSIMSMVGYPTFLPFSDGFNAYPASKGAVVQLTRDMGIRLAKEGIRVNAVCPGFTYTALTQNVTENEQVHQMMRDLHPMGRMGQPVEIANVIAFLASDEASFVTAAAWPVDGGYTAE